MNQKNNNENDENQKNLDKIFKNVENLATFSAAAKELSMSFHCLGVSIDDGSDTDKELAFFDITAINLIQVVQSRIMKKLQRVYQIDVLKERKILRRVKENI